MKKYFTSNKKKIPCIKVGYLQKFTESIDEKGYTCKYFVRYILIPHSSFFTHCNTRWGLVYPYHFTYVKVGLAEATSDHLPIF